jgi:hypothetical protein
MSFSPNDDGAADADPFDPSLLEDDGQPADVTLAYKPGWKPGESWSEGGRRTA